MCSGAREYRCWNGATVDGPLTSTRVSEAVLGAIEALPEFDEVFHQLINEEALKLDQQRITRLAELIRREDSLNRDCDNLLRFIRDGDSSGRVRAALADAEEQLKKVGAERARLETTPSDVVEIPSIHDIKTIAKEAISNLADDSWEFCRTMKRMIPRIVVFPYRACDGGHIVLRAKFRLQVGGILPDLRLQEVLAGPLETTLEVDLFDPPQRVQFREQVVEMRKQKREPEIAHELQITTAAAQRASALQRLMDRLQITDPYLPVTSPPPDFPRLRRHKHPRYRFDPKPDAGIV